MECVHKELEKAEYCRQCRLPLCLACGEYHKQKQHSVGGLLEEARKYMRELTEAACTASKRVWVLDSSLEVIRRFVGERSVGLLKRAEETLAELQVTLPQDVTNWRVSMEQELTCIRAFTGAFHSQQTYNQRIQNVERLLQAQDTALLAALFADGSAHDIRREFAQLAVIAQRTKALKREAEHYVRSMAARLDAVRDLRGMCGPAGEGLLNVQRELVRRLQDLRAESQEQTQQLRKLKETNAQIQLEMQTLLAEKAGMADRTSKLRQEGEELKRRLEDQRAESSKLNMENMYYKTKLETQRGRMSASVVSYQPEPQPPSQSQSQQKKQQQHTHLHYFVPLSNVLQLYTLADNKGLKYVVTEHKLYDNFDSIQLPGKIYLCGGYNIASCQISRETYEYNLSVPPSIPILRKADMITGRSCHKLVAVGEKSLYCLGGQVKAEYFNLCECFDILNDKWMPIASLMEKKANVAAAAFEDRVIYTFGGFNGKPLDTIEKLQIAEDKWNRLKIDKADNWGPRFGAGCLQINATTILIWGGLNADKVSTSNCYYFSPKTEHVTALSSTISLRAKEWFFMRSPIIHHDQLLAFGFHSTQLHRFNIPKQSWDIIVPQ